MKILKKISMAFAAFLFVGAILGYSVYNAIPLIEKISDSALKGTVKEKIAQFETILIDNLQNKNDFVTLNGFVSRYTGKRELNNVYRLPNGQLSYTSYYVADSLVDEHVQYIEELAAFLAERNTPLTYVVAPCKSSGEAFNIPIFGISNVVDATNYLFDKLKKVENVIGINLYTHMEEQQRDFYSQYFPTDHHWLPETAFWAVGETMKIMEDALGVYVDEESLKEENFYQDIYTETFLGSLGRRVGPYFAGKDDISLIYPSFDTEMEIYIPSHLMKRSGDFYNTIFDMGRMNNSDVYLSNQYSVYIGGDYATTYLRNSSAVNEKKILVVKDSFALPYIAYLSLQFQKVDVVDLRYYTERTLMEYIEATAPDHVMFCINSYAIRENHINTDYGAVEDLISNHELLDVCRDISGVIHAGEVQYAADDLVELQPGKEYLLDINEMTLNEENGGFIQVRVFDYDNKKTVANKTLTIGCDQQWRFKIPENEEPCSLLLYAGMAGSTANNILAYEGVNLYELTK